MRRVLAFWGLFFMIAAFAAEPEFVDRDWRDVKRDRVVPVRIYFEREKTGPRPVMIFSHGLGGSREGYAYLAQHWSKAGWIVVVVEHKGSNRDLLRSANPMQAMKRAAADPANAVNRPQDITFVIDTLEAMNREGEWKGRFNLKELGVGGHSFGAFTALASAGMKFILPDGTEKSFADPRIKAALVLSPSAGRRQMRQGAKALEDIRIPCFHMTGTLDDSPIGDTTAAERRWGFDHGKNPRFLLTFLGGDHMIFSGRPRLLRRDGPPKASDAVLQKVIAELSLDFLNGYVRDDKAAREKLEQGGEKAAKEKIATWEFAGLSADRLENQR